MGDPLASNLMLSRSDALVFSWFLNLKHSRSHVLDFPHVPASCSVPLRLDFRGSIGAL